MTDPTPVPETEILQPQKSGRKWLKGCGCITGLLALALGILVIGHFDMGAWASALGAVVIGTLVFSMSGTNGIWEK